MEGTIEPTSALFSQPFEDPKPYYLDLTENYRNFPLEQYDSMIEWIGHWDDEKYWKIKNCGVGAFKYECSEGHLSFRPNRCKEQYLCPKCSRQYADMESRIQEYLFMGIHEALQGIHVIMPVFTIPQRFKKGDPFKLLKRLRKAVKLCLSLYFGVYEGPDNLKFTFHSADHWWGEKNGVHMNPHLDIIMPAVGVYEKEVEEIVFNENGMEKKKRILTKFKKLDPYLDVEALREAWKLALNHIMGWDIGEDEPVDVWTQYIDMADPVGMKRLRRRLRYHNRLPVQDLLKHGTRIEDPAELYNLIRPPISHKRIVWFGWLSDSTKSHYMELLNGKVLKADLKKAITDDIEYVCPECGGPVEFVGYCRVEDMIENGHKEVVLKTGDDHG